MRLSLALFLIAVGVSILLWNPWRPRNQAEDYQLIPDPAMLTRGHVNRTLTVAALPDGPHVDTRRSPLADRLNAADGGIAEDLRILLNLFDQYRTVLHGNPTGSNTEITSALSGSNQHLYAPLPRDHKAIDTEGQLCDRWGSPFFFHNLSLDEMEVRSAGPDRKLWTADDAVIASPSIRT